MYILGYLHTPNQWKSKKESIGWHLHLLRHVNKWRTRSKTNICIARRRGEKYVLLLFEKEFFLVKILGGAGWGWQTEDTAVLRSPHWALGRPFLQALRFLFFIPVFCIARVVNSWLLGTDTGHYKHVKSTWHHRHVVASGDLQNFTSLIFKITF